MSLFERLVGAVGSLLTPKKGPAAPAHYTPYTDPAANAIYNLLFCDDLAAFRQNMAAPSGPFALLFQETADAAALLQLAQDESAEGRVRYLAFSALLKRNLPVPPKILLGVIVEMPLEGGLDTLAAFSEGGVRYINHTGKLSVLEAHPAILRKAQELLEVTRPVVEQMGPWGKDKARLPPPPLGQIRLSFLVSDGLYFGQGPFAVMEQGAMGGPIIRKATELLSSVVALNAPKK